LELPHTYFIQSYHSTHSRFWTLLGLYSLHHTQALHKHLIFTVQSHFLLIERPSSEST